MSTTQWVQFRLAGLALGVILALLIVPGSRWLVRAQFALALPTSAAVAPWSLGALQNNPAVDRYAGQRWHATAARNRDDYLLQFADAVMVPPAGGSLNSSLKVQRLRELAQRFPGRPGLYAAILRFSVQDQIRIQRAEETWLTGDRAPRPGSVTGDPVNTPPHLALFDQAAAEGERMDPDNAYFPLMRSVGLFAAHRDNDALAAFQRAAQKPHWTEYCRDELDGEWKLEQETFGTVGALPRMACADALLFPHYIACLSASHVAVAKAVEAELAGHPEEGLAIRDAVRRCGSRIRVQSTSLIGNLVGAQGCQISLMRPAGAAPIPASSNVSSDRLREQRTRAFDAYLLRIGHPEQIPAIDAETADEIRMREIARRGSLSPLFKGPSKLALLWIAGVLLLTNALWFLALGGGATLLARHPRIRTGQGLPPNAVPAAAFGLLAGALLAAAILADKTCLSSPYLVGGPLLSLILSLILALILVAAVPAAPGPLRLRSIGVFALSFGVTALLCTSFVWHVRSSIAPILQTIWISGADGAVSVAPMVSACSIAIAAAVPLLTLLTLGTLSRIWSVPLSVGVIRGLRGCAGPIACILLLAVSLLVPFTLRQESTLEAGLERTLQHEGRFVAELEGKEWPAVTHEQTTAPPALRPLGDSRR